MKDSNFSGQPVFSQIMKLIPKNLVLSLSRQNGGERYVKKFDAYQHLLVLLFSVMEQYKSINQILLGLEAESRRLVHAGLTEIPKRSTFADANGRRPAAIFERLYHELHKKYEHCLADSRDYFWSKRLYVMDSTTVSLFTDVMKGAGRNPKLGKKKGGVKAHTVMKDSSGVPEFVIVTPAAKHDSTELKKVKLPSESFLAIDRAYIDYKLFESFSKKKTTYVTRMKKNLKYDHVSDNPVSDNILRDENVQFHFVSRKKERVHRARIVEHYVEETGKTWRLLTNNNELPAKEIVEIYRRRWQIETFYRSLKQNFPLHFFYGDSENAIRIQIWIVMIANLLTAIVRAQTKRKLSFSSTVLLIRQCATYYVDLYKLLESPIKAVRDAYVGGLAPPQSQQSFLSQLN